MQKKLRTLLIIASLSLAASLVIVACGAGDPDLFESFRKEVVDSGGNMVLEIEDPKSPMWNEPPPPPPPSSEQPMSSAAPPNPGTSSGSEPPPPPPPPPSSNSTTPSSSSTPVVAATGCKESNPKEGFTCSWDKWAANATLTLGSTLKPSGNPPSGCTVKWKFAPNTTAMALKEDCADLPEAGTPALGSKNYVLFGELTCADGVHTTACNPKDGWSTKEAPKLVGECTWSKNPTTSARGAIPGSVTVSDPASICSSPSVEYKYSGGTKDWPKDGVVPAGTYTDVKAYLKCPAYATTVTGSTCPSLAVSAGADYQIVCSGDKCTEAKGVKADECIDVEVDWKDAGYSPTLKIACQVDRGGSSTGAISIKVGSKSPVSGNDYLAVEIVKITGVGPVEVNSICLTFPGGTSSTAGNCKISQ